jgi:hypothetical protein
MTSARLIALALALAVCGCVTRDALRFTGVGPVDVNVNAIVSEEFARLHDRGVVPPASIEVWEGNYPPGIIPYGAQAILIQPGAPYQFRGNFSLNFRKYVRMMTPAEAVVDVRRLAVAAGGDLVIVSFTRWSNGGYYAYADGFILKRMPGVWKGPRSPAPEDLNVPPPPEPTLGPLRRGND